MGILASGDSSDAKFSIEVDSDSKRAVRGTSAAGTYALFVAVQDMWREVFFDGPFS